MARKPKTDLEKEHYEIAKAFVRKEALDASRKVGYRVTFRLHKAHHARSRYEYDESADGEDQGRVTVVVRNKRASIIHSFVFERVVRKALRNLHATERIKKTKSENKWKGVYS